MGASHSPRRKCTPAHQAILLTAGDERPEVVVQAAAQMAHRQNRLNMFKRAGATTVSPVLAGMLKKGSMCVCPHPLFKILYNPLFKMAHRQNRLNMFKRAGATTVSPVLAGMLKKGSMCVCPHPLFKIEK